MKRWLFIVVPLVLLFAVGVGLRVAYVHNLGPVSADTRTQIITVEQGSGVKEIAAQLANAGLIRNAKVFEIYVHGRGDSAKLQAGVYALSPSQTLKEIVDTLSGGKVASKLVTILPGRRIDQIRADLINDGYSPSEVDAALQPANYKNLPLMSLMPANVTSLEGLLYPDSFQRTPNTPASDIITQSLNAMQEHLTISWQQAVGNQGLSPYQGIILASIVEQEVSKQSDRTQAAQVFFSRLKEGMPLGSDVTAFYGAVAAGRSPSLTYDSPYNTLIHGGLPVGPISTVSDSSLAAVANPATTSWLYFVAGDDGTTHFTKTLAEHQAATNAYCHKLCAAP